MIDDQQLAPNPAAGAALLMGALVGLEAFLFALVILPVPILLGGFVAELVIWRAARTRSKGVVVFTGVLLMVAVPFVLWLFLVWAFSHDHS
jgi:hypothetical protein